MASFDKIVMATLLAVCVVVMISPALVAESLEAAFVKDCIAKLSEGCGHEIFGKLTADEFPKHECCDDLVFKMGQVCHITLVKYALKNNPKFSASKVNAKSGKIWNSCVSGAFPPM